MSASPPSGSPGPQPELSVVVPVYNEADNLRELLAELVPIVRGASASHELVFVDDGSTDGSGELLDGLAADAIRVLHFDRNYGLSSALHAGFHAARGELIASLDADLQNDPHDLPRLLQALREGADMACGWRHERQDNWVKRASSRIANRWRNWRTRSAIHDSTCPLKAFRRPVLDVFYPFDGLHRFLPTLAAMRGFRVVEIPVGHRPRVHGTSKYGIKNRLARGLRDLRTIRWMQTTCMHYAMRAERDEPQTGAQRRSTTAVP